MAKGKLTPTRKFFIGMLGSISPTIVLWYQGKLSVAGLEFIGFSAWLLPHLAMACLSGFIARYYGEENPLKLFYVGITAPALILNLALPPASQLPSTTKDPFRTTSLWSGSVAHAQSTPPTLEKEIPVKEIQPPSVAEQIQQGLNQAFGRQGGKWFVVVGSHEQLEEARKQVRTLQKKKVEAQGFQPEIYTYSGSGYYAVTIGANLSYEEAKRLKEKAQLSPIIPKDIYLWSSR